MKYIVTITELAPTEPKDRDVHSYHIIVDDGLMVAKVVENFFLNYGCLVSIMITPFRED